MDAGAGEGCDEASDEGREGVACDEGEAAVVPAVTVAAGAVGCGRRGGAAEAGEDDVEERTPTRLGSTEPERIADPVRVCGAGDKDRPCPLLCSCCCCPASDRRARGGEGDGAALWEAAPIAEPRVTPDGLPREFAGMAAPVEDRRAGVGEVVRLAVRVVLVAVPGVLEAGESLARDGGGLGDRAGGRAPLVCAIEPAFRDTVVPGGSVLRRKPLELVGEEDVVVVVAVERLSGDGEADEAVDPEAGPFPEVEFAAEFKLIFSSRGIINLFVDATRGSSLPTPTNPPEDGPAVPRRFTVTLAVGRAA